MSNPKDYTQEEDVEIYNRVNRLKVKAGGEEDGGPGKFDQSVIDNANTVITKMASLYPKEIENVLKALDKEWDQLKATDDEAEKKRLVERLSNTANQIKDLAGTFSYTLMEYFGDSLCTYILETSLDKEEQFIIVQAHVDVMGVAFREGLKDDDGGAVAEELKATVQKAIEKYN